MRSKPGWRSIIPRAKPQRPPHVPPKCREVIVEVPGMNPGTIRIDIVSDPAPPAKRDETPASLPEPKEARWDTIEQAIEATKPKAVPRPDPWARLTR